MVIQIIQVWLFVVSLQWESSLFPLGFWSATVGADDILSQLKLSLPTATKVLYGELLKNNKFLQFMSRWSTQILLPVHQILHGRLLVEYLRWKFKLVPPDSWSLRNARWIDNSFISVVCFDENENYRRNLFYKAEVHHQLAAIFMNLPCWHLATASGPARIVFCKAAKALDMFVNILFGLITKYVTISQFLTHELFDRTDIMTHRELCKNTNLESTEDFCTSADMFASFLEQPASQLVGSNDAKAPIHPGEFSTSMAAQILLKAILILYVWMWVDYLRWKFKFPSTSLWRMGLSMGATIERVVLGVWFSTYYELRSHLKLEARSGVDWVTSDGYNPGDFQHILE